MAFPKKKLVTPPIEDINEKFQEVRVKVVPGGVKAKVENSRGAHVKVGWKSREVKTVKIGTIIHSLKVQNSISSNCGV